MQRHLSETASNWLLIFDDADDPSISFSKYFPIGGNGTILITTRNEQFKLLATVGSSDLGRMKHEDAIRLFSAVGGSIDSDPVARANATSIVDLLGGIPLGLTQASQFIKTSNCTIGQYLKMLEDQRELQLRRNTHIGTAHFGPLEIMFQNIEEMSSEVTRDALELLYFFSFIPTESVYAEELLARAWRNDMELQHSSRVAIYQLRVLCNPANVDWQPSRLRKALEFLVSFALIRQERKGNEISFPLLVLEFAHNRLSKDELVEYSNITAHTLASAAGTILEDTSYYFRAALLSHITCFLRRHNNDFAKDSGVEDLASILSSFSPAFRDSGQYEKALELETRAMHLRLRLLGAEHPDTLSSMNRIGRHLRDLQRPHEALQVDSETLDSWRRTLGIKGFGSVKPREYLAKWHEIFAERHKGRFSNWETSRLQLGFYDTVELLECLANDYEMLDEHQEAKLLLETVLELKLEVFGHNADETTTTMSHLACSYRHLGRYTEALKLEEKVFLQRQRTFGQEHRFTINSLDNLAITYGQLGRQQKAAELLQKVLEISLKVMGDRHPDSITSMHNLAVSYSKLRRHDKAAVLEAQVLDSRKEILGIQHQDTLQAMADLAIAYESLNRYSEALRLRVKVVEYKMILGSLAPTTWKTMTTKGLLRYSETNIDSDSYEALLSRAAPISSASSYNHSQATAIESLVVALESDLELAFAFEDAMWVTSKRKFLRQHVLLLQDFLSNVQTKTAEWREAVKFFSGKRIIRRIAVGICNRTSANSTLLNHGEETSERPPEFHRSQLPINVGTVSLKRESREEHSADQHEANDENEDNDEVEDSDPGYGRKLHEINVLQPDKMVRFLIGDVCFLQYKSSLQTFVHQNCSPHTLRSVIRLGNLDAVSGIIERHFDAVATDDFEWLQELKSLGYGSRDIAELLLDDMKKSQWIYFSQPTPQDTAIHPGFHVSNCIHEGGKKADLAPKLIVEPLENNEDMKRFIAEHCGLAGVVPKSRDSTTWTGVVAFSGDNQDTASISYNIPGSRDQFMWRACEALRRFCGVASYLQKKCLCCNSFTVLRYTSVDGSMAIELRQVDFRLASDLFQVLQLVRSNFKSPSLVSRCLPQLTLLANEVIRIVCDDHAFTHEDALNFEDCLDRVSLAAQILTLGLYLYSQAHTGSVHPFCLMDPLLHIYLFGTQSPVQDSTRAHVQVSLSSLTCMAGVTGDRVTVFGSCNYSESRSSDKSYDLLASPEGLADTWDVWRLITDGRALHGEGIYAIEIGDGLISCAGEVQHSTDLGITIPKLHWNRGKGDLGSATPFSLHSKALIGTATVNPLCPVDVHQSWLIAQVGMATLGTEDSYWEPEKAQVGLQLGEYAALMFNTSWARREGRTLKHIHLRPDINLSFLQSDWGLQISYCTGVARRVSLCHLLADVTPVLIDALVQKPPGWSDLRTVHDIIGALRGTNFRDWIEALAPALQTNVVQIVRYVLLLLQDTGIDRSGENLVAIWPQKNEPLGCLKIPCKNATSWARILADSPHCATFAYITPICLIEDNCECQRLQAAPWHNRSLALNTAVSRFVNSGIVTTGPWALRHEQSYLIGTPEKYFLGKAIISNNPPRLYISTSMIPERLQARIKERIREKQCTDARAHGVVVLAKA